MWSKRKKIGIALGVFFLGLAVSGFEGFFALWNQIPEQMYVSASDKIPELFHGLMRSWMSEQISVEMVSPTGLHTVSDLDIDLSYPVSAPAVTHYKIDYSLFGVIPVKTASVTIVDPVSVYAGGIPIGIYLETDGVLVIDTDEVTSTDGQTCAPAANILRSGDYIRCVNGIPMTCKEDLIRCINQSQGDDMLFDVDRNGEMLHFSVTPVRTGETTYQAGIWVRNDTQGIGTLTYVDKNGYYGALGHGISDVDTGELLRTRNGVLYTTDVISIIKGASGVPGELAGVIHYEDRYQIGTIDRNVAEGIYGHISAFPQMAEHLNKYEIGYRQDITPGPATILCSLGGETEEFEIEIQDVRMNDRNTSKGMVLKVTDPDLLERTGGIVQGMSGSPIIQNGKLVGAVTHVFVQDSTRGYGIFIENMLSS